MLNLVSTAQPYCFWHSQTHTAKHAPADWERTKTCRLSFIARQVSSRPLYASIRSSNSGSRLRGSAGRRTVFLSVTAPTRSWGGFWPISWAPSATAWKVLRASSASCLAALAPQKPRAGFVALLACPGGPIQAKPRTRRHKKTGTRPVSLGFPGLSGVTRR